MALNKNENRGFEKKEVANRRKAILSDDTAFVAKESYKASRTNILFSVPNEDSCNVILFTSSVPGEGKTTTCVNTAISFAQTGAKVLLIEADLRRPKVSECFDKEITEGLSNVLAGFAEAEDVITHIEEYGVDVMGAGWIPPNPTELLSSKRVKTLLEELKSKYEYIFIDTPPVNTVTDAVVLTKYVNGVIVVVRSKYTMKQNLTKAVNTLKFSNAKILGFIVNDSYVSRSNTRYRGYKKYGNYYYYNSYGDKKTRRSKDGDKEKPTNEPAAKKVKNKEQ